MIILLFDLLCLQFMVFYWPIKLVYFLLLVFILLLQLINYHLLLLDLLNILVLFLTN